MIADQLRQALGELNAERDAVFCFAGGNVENLIIPNAILIPAEEDGLVKVSDGKHVYVIDAERVAWIKIG